MAEDQNRSFQDKFMLRFPDGMRERIKEIADTNGRSMNAEIILRLQESLDSSFEDDENFRRMLKKLLKRMEELDRESGRKTDEPSG